MAPSTRNLPDAPAYAPIRITRAHAVEATISLSEPDEVFVAVEVTAGHIPVTARRELVDAIFALPEVRRRHRMRATVPVGDRELLDALADYFPAINTRAAGVTCLVDARR